jgi:type I restriction enzyme S subunit
MRFVRYPKYKVSGVDWLGEVPEGWKIHRLKYASRTPIKNGLGESAESDDPDQPRYVRITDIKSTRELHVSTFKSLPKEVADLAPVQIGDILFACVGATFGKSYLHLVDSGPMCYAGYLAKCSPKPNIDARFISYWTESMSYWNQLRANVIQSTIQNFSAAKYRDLLLAVPDSKEQNAVVKFLDLETGKIDGLLAEQRRLMELLKAKRHAVISHAVTKGLNPHAPMKPSGIEWLGDVPEHWEAGPLKRHITKVESGTSVNSSDEPAEDGKLGVLKTSCVYRGYFDPTENKTVVLDDVERVSCPVRAGTLIVSRMNTPELIGAAGLVVSAPSNLYLPDRLWQISFSSVDVRFVHFWTLTTFYRAQVESVCTGTSPSMKNLGQDQFGCFAIAIPPLNEQIATIEFLDTELAKFDNLTTEAQRAIDLLQERRTALISAAVTGQIDVRQHLNN